MSLKIKYFLLFFILFLLAFISSTYTANASGTVEAWISFDALPTSDASLFYWSDYPNGSISVKYLLSGGTGMALAIDDGSGHDYPGNFIPDLETWYHLEFIVDSGEWDYYIDDDLYLSHSGNDKNPSGWATNCDLGMSGNNGMWDCSLEEQVNEEPPTATSTATTTASVLVDSEQLFIIGVIIYLLSFGLWSRIFKF